MLQKILQRCFLKETNPIEKQSFPTLAFAHGDSYASCLFLEHTHSPPPPQPPPPPPLKN